jgi:hypothetical protein
MLSTFPPGMHKELAVVVGLLLVFFLATGWAWHALLQFLSG